MNREEEAKSKAYLDEWKKDSIDKIVLKDKRRIVKMVVHYSDGATITLEGGEVGRTGDWE
mgnify:CR=1 FL=1|tara:strand:+ start:1702 stop:1881 length:180 start_codon:yes stop_codon:yes gene_type:complete